MLQTDLTKVRYRQRLALVAIGITISLAAASCGDDAATETAQVASLGTLAETTQTTAVASTQDTQAALLAYAACMRENGIDMADPTFDADGNATGGLFGPDSGIDPRADGFQAAQEACGSLIEGVTLGGGPGGQGGGLDLDAVQASMNEFTGCLRDEGLEVDDIEFGGGQGPVGGTGGGFGGGPPAGGTLVDGATPPAGSIPAGGFAGGPPADGGPGGEGFDPTSRVVEQLDLDAEDPVVIAALEVCQPILEGAFQPAATATTTN